MLERIFKMCVGLPNRERMIISFTKTVRLIPTNKAFVESLKRAHY
jgi:hypothetical protein